MNCVKGYVVELQGKFFSFNILNGSGDFFDFWGTILNFLFGKDAVGFKK